VTTLLTKSKLAFHLGDKRGDGGDPRELRIVLELLHLSEIHAAIHRVASASAALARHASCCG
jgi:hypothetical protein